jgi:hypothetical protein
MSHRKDRHSLRSRRQLERLEPRTLLSATITPYTIPDLAGFTSAYDSDGNLWVLNYNNQVSGFSLDEVSPSSATPIHSIALDSHTYSPVALAAGPGNIIYAADSNGGIDIINTTSLSASQYLFSSGLADTPVALTVTGNGAIWFVGTNTSSIDTGPGGEQIVHQDNIIGRIDPNTLAVSESTLGALPDDAFGYTLAPSGADSVWVALNSTVVDDPTQVSGYNFGHNHIVAASYSGSLSIDNVYGVSTGDTNADRYNLISSIVDGGGGTVWFTLGNNNLGLAATTAPDQIVEGAASGGDIVALSVYTLPGADASTALGVGSLNIDVDGNLWFIESAGAEFGFLGISDFTTYAAGSTQFQMSSNLAGDQLTIVSGGEDLIQIDIPTTGITFSGSANDINIQEDTPIPGSTMLATFVAPTPLSGYTATITWGDSTQSTGIVQDIGSNTYVVIVSGKSFATQGNYDGTVEIKDGDNLVGTLNFTSHVGDIPLNVTSVTAVPLFLRFVTVVGTFTDDADLSLSTFTATINWGDNTSSNALIVRDPTQPGRYLVLALHQYRTRGTYNVTLSVSTSEDGADITNSTLSTTVIAR